MTLATEYANARNHAAFFDVSDRGKIELTGPEAAKFLHNLCTNDILSLAVGSGREAFFCTAKAKVIAHVFIVRTPDSFWIDTAPGTAEKLFKHLDRHLISEQVELADRTADFAQFSLAGPEVPELPMMRRHDSLGLPGCDVLVPQEEKEAVRRRLIEAGVREAGPETYNLLRIEAGFPLYGVDIDDERFVVEVGRIKQAICYTKGCYLGQEPIVMARDRGHVNRTLMGVKLTGTEAVAPGTKLLRAAAEVGQVTSSVVSPRFGPIALAYLRRGNWEAGTVVQIEGSEATGEVVALPFV